MEHFQFAEHHRFLRKILVIELLGLGDNIHLLPALYQLRAALPEAELHVMSRSTIADLFVATPWVDRVWRYPVSPRKPTPNEHLQLVRALRAEQFDLVLNSSSNDRSTWLTGLSGSTRRVGRVPRKGRLLHWRLSHNYEVAAPYADRPMWQQKVEALRDAGVPPVAGPRFHVERPALERVDARVRALDGQSYLHVSPFSAEDCRGLPDAETAAMLNALQALDPSRPIVISTGPSAREARKWQAIAARLDFTPARLFAGDLDTVSFLRLVSGALLHVGPDSGGVHVARMFGVPTVSWIREHVSREWIADEPGSHALVSRRQNDAGVLDISGAQVAAAAAQYLSGSGPQVAAVA
jgi:heptosyltransferase-3